MSRIAVIKMNVLPKVLFLVQRIPIVLKKSLFWDLNKMVMNFMWRSKKPRIWLKAMQDFKHKASFELPDWETYYRARTLVWIKEWVTLRNRRLLKLEGYDFKLDWHAFLWYQKSKEHKYVTNHIFWKALLTVWKTCWQIYKKIPGWVSLTEAFVYPILI